MISVVESVILVNINIPTDLGMSNHRNRGNSLQDGHNSYNTL